MISYKKKRLFYILAIPVFWCHYLISKIKLRNKSGSCVQFGPGQKNYLKGWINIDANFLTAKTDIVSNLDWGLPIRNSSVSHCYSHHVIEHLRSIEYHFSEVFRILVQGGVYRVGVPNADSAIVAFVNGRFDWFSDFPKKWTSIGGKFNNFLMCEGEHLTICTESFLTELALRAGFSTIKLCGPQCRSHYPGLFGDCIQMEENESIQYPHTLILELVK
jgi:hypothetical protein